MALTFVIRVEDIIIDPKRKTDLALLTEQEAIVLIKKHYGYLSQDIQVVLENGMAVITYDPSDESVEAAKSYQRASDFAARGDHQRALPLFEKAIKLNPTHVDARRDYAMALFESGDVDNALEHLIKVLNQDPTNEWALVLVGNIFFNAKKDHQTAEKYYLSALAQKPDDIYALSNYASVLAHTFRLEEAVPKFEEAIAVDPDYPNSYFGLALTQWNRGNAEEAQGVIDRLFERPKSKDPRSKNVYSEARRLWATIQEALARKNEPVAMELAERVRVSVAEKTGVAIEVKRDEEQTFPLAVIEMAWNHGRDHHVIRYSAEAPAEIVPHILLHELSHVILEAAAFDVGRSKSFGTSNKTKAEAKKAMTDFLNKLKRRNEFNSQYEGHLDFMIEGLCNQLFNYPVDMLIEYEMYEKYPEARPAQFLSLAMQIRDNEQIVKDPRYADLAPPVILKSNMAMNCCFALFADRLYRTKTEYAAPYKDDSAFAIGARLFKEVEKTRERFSAGAEYLLIDTFAEILKLKRWYLWVEGRNVVKAVPQAADERQESRYVTNRELLDEKAPAAVMYLLGAMEMFDKMSIEEVREVAFEIAIVGMDGLDYASAEQKYTLRSVPGRKFSGLQMMAMMYVGFKRVEPSQDSGIPLDKEYEQALRLYRRDW